MNNICISIFVCNRKSFPDSPNINNLEFRYKTRPLDARLLCLNVRYIESVARQAFKYRRGYALSQHLSNPGNLGAPRCTRRLYPLFSSLFLPPLDRRKQRLHRRLPYFGRNSKSTRQSAASRDRRGPRFRCNWRHRVRVTSPTSSPTSRSRICTYPRIYRALPATGRRERAGEGRGRTWVRVREKEIRAHPQPRYADGHVAYASAIIREIDNSYLLTTRTLRLRG